MLSPKVSIRFLLLSALPILAAAKPVVAEDPRDFQADLLHVAFSIHVRNVDTERDLLGYRIGQSKTAIAPRVKRPSTILREPAYDVSEQMKEYGLDLPPGSRAIYSPRTELFFLESTGADQKLTQTILDPFPLDTHRFLTVDVRVSIKTAGKVETLLDMKSIPFLSGQTMELAAARDGSAHLSVDFVLGPDGETCDVETRAEIQAGGKSLHEKAMRMVRFSQPDETTLGTLDGASVILRMQTHCDLEYTGPPSLATPANKAAAIQEIKTALRATPGR